MKKTYVLLTALLVALLLFAACTKAPDQNDAQPPVSDNNTAQDSNSAQDDTVPPVSADNGDTNDTNGSSADTPPVDTPPVDSTPAEEIVCEFDTVTLKCFKRGTGYVNTDGEWKVETHENELEYTFYYDWENDSFVDEIYKLLKQIDTTMNPLPSTDIISYTARFYHRDGESEELIVFSPPSGGTGYGAKRVWVKVSDDERRPLTIEASERFMQLCSDKGLDKSQFFSVDTATSMEDWLSSLWKREPILLYDENRELTPEQVVEQTLDELGRELTKPDINRFFIIKDYEGWDFDLYSNKEENAYLKNNEFYKLWTLTDDQYIVVPREIHGKYEGLTHDGIYDSHFFLEYEAGIWRLWLRNRP